MAGKKAKGNRVQVILECTGNEEQWAARYFSLCYDKES